MRIRPITLLPLLLLGCGGSSHHHGGTTDPTDPTDPVVVNDGKAIVNITWPARATTFTAPVSSNSVVVVLKLGSTEAGRQTVVRPADGGPTQTLFTSLAYGTYTVNLTAYPTQDGVATDPTAIAQATGSGTVVVAKDVTGTANITTQASTVTQLSISPATVTLDKGATATLNVSATDAAGNIVLLSAGGGTEPIDVTTLTPGILTATNDGSSVVLTGVHSGTTTVHVQAAAGSGGVLSADATVTVRPINDGSGTVTVQ